MKDAPLVCYLCGHPLVDDISRDHVPPQQLYADEIRKTNKLDLLTIPAHKTCNLSYQLDEDYFFNTLAPLGKGSYSGNSFLSEVFQKYASNKKKYLVQKVLEEFDRTPSGILLANGQVAKRFEGQRVHRVAWKIVRGLYFHRFGSVLPLDTPNHLEIVPPGQTPPREFFALLDKPVQGKYPGVFDYRFMTFPEMNDFNYWGMLLWDRIILIVAFHAPSCNCSHCTTVKESREAVISVKG